MAVLSTDVLSVSFWIFESSPKLVLGIPQTTTSKQVSGYAFSTYKRQANFRQQHTLASPQRRNTKITAMAFTKLIVLCFLALATVCLAMPQWGGGFGGQRPSFGGQRPSFSSGTGLGLANTGNNFAGGLGTGTGSGQYASYGAGLGLGASFQIPGGPSFNQAYGQGFGGGF